MNLLQMSAEDEKIFLPVDEVTLEGLHINLPSSLPTPSSSSQNERSGVRSQGRTTTGTRIATNEEDIALFRVGDEVFAVQEKCPHAGGPLHLGDIEMLPDKKICVRCPWHGWTFDIRTGRICYPKGRDEKITVYPVQIKERNKIYVGFDAINSKYFGSDSDDSSK